MNVATFFAVCACILACVAAGLIKEEKLSDEIVCEVKCTILTIVAQKIDHDSEKQYICEMDREYENGMSGVWYTIEGLDDLSTLGSGEISLYSKNAICRKYPVPHSGGSIIVRPGYYELENKMTNYRMSDPIEDDVRPILILYTVAIDAQNDEITPDEMANKVFGICEGCSDPPNLVTQISNCSGGKVTFVPACSRQTDSCYGDLDIVNGVLEVHLNYNITNLPSTAVATLNKSAAKQILEGKNLSFEEFYIFHVIPNEADWGSAAAWAKVPGRISAYQDTYANRVGVQVHEVGHNLGFQHSGFEGDEYADHSCSMRNSVNDDEDRPLLCFNGAKSWESGWYNEDSLNVDVFNNQVFDGHLVGVDDYVHGRFTSGTHKVVLQIPEEKQVAKYYVMFNRKEGINGDVSFESDKVTIVRGSASTVSQFQAGLDETNNSFSVENFGNSSQTLVIKVCEMNFVDNFHGPDTARVLVSLDDKLSCEIDTPSISPSRSPTDSPFAAPSISPSRSPTYFPSSNPTDSPFAAPSISPSINPTYVQSSNPTDTPFAAPSISPSTRPTFSPSLQPTEDPWLIKHYTIFHESELIFVSHEIKSGPRDADVTILQADCSSELAEDDMLSLHSGPFTYPSKNVSYSIFVDKNKLDSSELVTFDDNFATSGTINFCVKVVTKTSYDLNVSGMKLKLKIAFDISDIGFNLGEMHAIDPSPEDIVYDIPYSVSACECDVNFKCTSTVYTQDGTAPVLRVCIKPSSVDTFISRLELVLENDDHEHKVISFDDDITSLRRFSDSNSTVMVSTRLVSDLFSSDLPFVTVKGLANLNTGARKSMNLQTIGPLQIRTQGTKTESNDDSKGCFDFLMRFFI